MTLQQQISLSTKGHGDMHDLTEQVAAIVNSSGITTGLMHVFNVGSTAALGTIEFEPGLQQDLPAILDELIPPSRNYGHERTWHDGNGHSHLQATLLGPSLTVPVAEGKLVLGTWQQVPSSRMRCARASAHGRGHNSWATENGRSELEWTSCYGETRTSPKAATQSQTRYQGPWPSRMPIDRAFGSCGGGNGSD